MGDFFNEIFHNHPNLLTMESVMFHELSQKNQNCKKGIAPSGRQDAKRYDGSFDR